MNTHVRKNEKVINDENMMKKGETEMKNDEQDTEINDDDPLYENDVLCKGKFKMYKSKTLVEKSEFELSVTNGKKNSIERTTEIDRKKEKIGSNLKNSRENKTLIETLDPPDSNLSPSYPGRSLENADRNLKKG